MALKGYGCYGLWVNLIQRAEPHRGGDGDRLLGVGGFLLCGGSLRRRRDVALPVAFERQNFE
jgi:hypothetical protein